MKKNKIVFIIIVFSIFSCHQADQKKATTVSLVNTTQDSIENDKITLKDTLNQSLSPASDTLVFHLKMDTTNQHLIIPVTISSGKELNALLFSTDKNANIRISQIEFPDSTFDGPFGKEIHYKIKMPGNFNIIIGEDMMAGDRWTGDFILKVSVK
ncbi:MAG: hypothetical protein ABI359_03745 [Ginsengibacter sp.]